MSSDMWLNIAFVITLLYDLYTNKSYGVQTDGQDYNHGGNFNIWLKLACLGNVLSHPQKPMPDNADGEFSSFTIPDSHLQGFMASRCCPENSLGFVFHLRCESRSS